MVSSNVRFTQGTRWRSRLRMMRNYQTPPEWRKIGLNSVSEVMFLYSFSWKCVSSYLFNHQREFRNTIEKMWNNFVVPACSGIQRKLLAVHVMIKSIPVAQFSLSVWISENRPHTEYKFANETFKHCNTAVRRQQKYLSTKDWVWWGKSLEAL